MTDDYKKFFLGRDLASGAIAGESSPFGMDHSIKIEVVEAVLFQVGAAPLAMKIVSTSEKYRDSGVYRKVLNQEFDVNDSVYLSIPSGSFYGFYLPN